MSSVKWREILGWNLDQLEELRFTGFTFLREGKYEKALLFFKTLVLLDPTNAYDQQTLGALYLQMGKGELALEAIDKALMLDESHEPTLLNKLKTLLLLHRKEEALTLARKLQTSADITIAGDASALLVSYS